MMLFDFIQIFDQIFRQRLLTSSVNVITYIRL